jgi:DNA invertase Pin-like site-specific DNA recombinase
VEAVDRGNTLRILTGRLAGTYTPTGEWKFFFTMMAAFAELELDMLRERTMAGLAAARAQGRTGGRPSVMDGDTFAAARARRVRVRLRSPKPSGSHARAYTAISARRSPDQ